MELDINNATKDMRRETRSNIITIITHHILQVPLRQVHYAAPFLRQRYQRSRTRVPQLQTHRRRLHRRRIKLRRRRIRIIFIHRVEINHSTHRSNPRNSTLLAQSICIAVILFSLYTEELYYKLRWRCVGDI